VVVSAGVGLAVVGGVVAASLAAGRRTAPALVDPSVPRMERDRGAGERLLLVVGGAFPTREAAEVANAGISFGDVQGFYVAPTDQFVGLREVLGPSADDFVLVSAFRTGRGARDFLELAEAAGAPALLTPRLENLGWAYAGLGQETHPDGTGPLTEPIPGLTT
ncbi:MAG TPA: hypothetical protein VHH92_06775, partial [Actinomycetota bacterium]|nr:hypothetical protein [Actinomycetota bacterium]